MGNLMMHRYPKPTAYLILAMVTYITYPDPNFQKIFICDHTFAFLSIEVNPSKSRSKGRFLRIVERAKGFTRSAFLGRGAATSLVAWIRGLQSTKAVNGLRASWKQKFRALTVFGRENVYGKYVRMMEFPYDRKGSAILCRQGLTVWVGEVLQGWWRSCLIWLARNICRLQ